MHSFILCVWCNLQKRSHKQEACASTIPTAIGCLNFTFSRLHRLILWGWMVIRKECKSEHSHTFFLLLCPDTEACTEPSRASKFSILQAELKQEVAMVEWQMAGWTETEYVHVPGWVGGGCLHAHIKTDGWTHMWVEQMGGRKVWMYVSTCTWEPGPTNKTILYLAISHCVQMHDKICISLVMTSRI